MQLSKVVQYVTALITCQFLLSCNSFPDKHPDPAKNNPVTYRRDMQDCAHAYPETPDGVYMKQRISCMNLKGWK